MKAKEGAHAARQPVPLVLRPVLERQVLTEKINKLLYAVDGIDRDPSVIF